MDKIKNDLYKKMTCIKIDYIKSDCIKIDHIKYDCIQILLTDSKNHFQKYRLTQPSVYTYIYI